MENWQVLSVTDQRPRTWSLDFSVTVNGSFDNKIRYTLCPEKKRPKGFFYNISCDSDENAHVVSSINLLQKGINVFHLTRIMSLYYPMKLENHCARAKC